MRLLRFDLYKDLKCPRCNLDDESFNHIFTCSTITTKLQTIIHNSKRFLTSLIQEHIDSQFHINHLEDQYLWHNNVHDTNLTFIDLIKGVVPRSLINKIQLVTNNQAIIQMLLSLFFDYIYAQFSDTIWKERCEIQLNIEKRLGIDKKEKKKRVHDPNNVNRLNHNNNNNHTSFTPTYHRSLNSIKYGGPWERFIN